MPPTPTALLMTVLALLLLPTCSCFRTVSRSSAARRRRSCTAASSEGAAAAAAAGSPGAAPTKKKKSVAWVEGTSDALTC